MIDRNIVLNSLIGVPYKLGQDGPEEFDCWGLARYVQKNLFNRELPKIENRPSTLLGMAKLVRDHSVRKEWSILEKPVDGCLVEMSHNKHCYHIGVYLSSNGGGIIHSIESIGVCWDRLIHLKAAGWRKFVYHGYIG